MTENVTNAVIECLRGVYPQLQIGHSRYLSKGFVSGYKGDGCVAISVENGNGACHVWVNSTVVSIGQHSLDLADPNGQPLPDWILGIIDDDYIGSWDYV